MNGNMTTQNGAGLPATQGTDPFSAYAAKVTQQAGQFLSFDKGIWLYGQDKAKLAIGTKLAANVAGLMIGWRRWFGGKVTDEMLEPLVAQVPVPPRNTLGDNDPAMWERDERTGTPRDPWVFTNTLQLVDNEGESYIYSASSKGGLNAIGQLCKVYGQEYRQRPGMVPIVELGGDSYMHSNSEYGLIHTPVLTVVGWTSAEAVETEGAETEQPVEQIALPAAPQGRQRAANPTPTSTTKSPSSRAPRF